MAKFMVKLLKYYFYMTTILWLSFYMHVRLSY